MNRYARGAGELLTALVPLVSSRDASALGAAAADVSQRALAAAETIVILRTEAGERVARAGEAPTQELEAWARSLLEERANAEVVSSGQYMGACVSSDELGLRCLVAASAPSLAAEAAREVLPPLARLLATRAEDLERSAREARALQEARKFIGKGLHDLRTPLNSLRLGMHLLAPGLATQDPAVVDRTNRAIDRMAALVTEMFDALHKG